MSHITKYGDFAKDFMNHRGMLLTGDELHGLDTLFKFGHNDAVGTDFTCISPGGVCQLPKPSDATTLRVKAGGNVNDTASGDGARSVILQGINELGAGIQEVLVLAGALASASTNQKFMRLNRVIVLETGVYPTDFSSPGAADNITIENTAGTADWTTVTVNGFADCQSQLAFYSVPAGQRAYLSAVNIFVDATQVVDLVLVVRQNFMDETAGFTPVRVGATINGVEGHVDIPFTEPPRFAEFTDVAMLARTAAGTAAVSVQMTFVLNSIAPAA